MCIKKIHINVDVIKHHEAEFLKGSENENCGVLNYHTVL